MAIVIEGPLAPWASEMAEVLEKRGHNRRMVTKKMGLVGKLSRFLACEGVEASELTPKVLDEFIRVQRQRGKSEATRPTAKSFVWLVDYLTGIGVLAAPIPPVPQSPEEELLERYRGYLVVERGLQEETATLYLRTVTPFLAEHRVDRFDALTAGDVARFVTRRCRALSVRGAERLVTCLRSFLGFVFLEGLIGLPLAASVPSTARWSGASLPRGLAPKQVRAMLATCDRRRAIGRRDYAILLLLSRLGLRAAEVAALRLEDIDWRAGVIVVRGKGSTEERLPLPADVGEAIAAYLRRGRPRRSEREVFLTVVAPIRGLAPQGVSEVVRVASERAGVGSFGAHRLRHTAATQLLRAGASLSEVAEVLRHRSVTVTALYAKVDHLALAELAMPWPGCGR
jgi:integrase/recombinase XerD